jgi:hypothetical protein
LLLGRVIKIGIAGIDLYEVVDESVLNDFFKVEIEFG